MLDNAKPYFFLNEMNKKDLPAMYSTAFWYLFVVLLVVLALLRNRCYSSTSRNKNAVFFAEIQIRSEFFSSSPRRKPLLPLWEIGSKKNP